MFSPYKAEMHQQPNNNNNNKGGRSNKFEIKLTVLKWKFTFLVSVLLLKSVSFKETKYFCISLQSLEMPNGMKRADLRQVWWATQLALETRITKPTAYWGQERVQFQWLQLMLEETALPQRRKNKIL